MAASTPTTELSPLLSLQCKTWVLKVNIHCEGCKRKVKKILMSMEDVYRVEVDSEQNEVAVTGNVDSDALIRRLLKSGKHAQLSPEKITVKKDGGKEKRRPKSNNLEKKAADKNSVVDGELTGDLPSQQTEKVGGKVLVPAKNGDGAKSEAVVDSDVSKLVDIPVPGSPAGESVGKVAGEVGDGEGGVEKADSGKKKKKGQQVQTKKAYEAGHVDGNDAVDESLLSSYYPVHPPASHQSPIYAVSYHATHPAGKYIVNYAPPQAYARASHEWEPHHMFSDENAHFCSVM